MADRNFRNLIRLAVVALFAVVVPPSLASAREVRGPIISNASPLDERAEQLVSVLKGATSPDDYFAPSFLAAIPVEKFSELAKSFVAQYGQPLRMTGIAKNGDNSGTLQISYEKGVGTFLIYIDPAKPHKVTGLLAKGFRLTDDSFAKIDAEFKALPGIAGYGIHELHPDGRVETLNAINHTRQYAIGSTFKLYILARLASEVEAGQRKWADVAPLNRPSFSSSATNGWPANSPVTLYSLATWMISVSDNSATDTLLFLLGREAIEEKFATIGNSNPDKTLPFLSTVEAFALKSAANADLRGRFVKASEAQQRDFLMNEASGLAYDKIDPATFSTGPAHIDTIEWFATPGDIALVFDNIRRSGSKEAMDIMAINPGLPQGSAARWKYVGYKGGSEPGVISLNYLLQAPSGKWLVVSGSWNNSKAVVEDARFAMLMARLVDRVAE